MVDNISNPESAEFVRYINKRGFTVADVKTDLAVVGDLGPESIKSVSADHRPTGKPMLIVGNEVSSTTFFTTSRLLPSKPLRETELVVICYIEPDLR